MLVPSTLETITSQAKYSIPSLSRFDEALSEPGNNSSKLEECLFISGHERLETCTFCYHQLRSSRTHQVQRSLPDILITGTNSKQIYYCTFHGTTWSHRRCNPFLNTKILKSQQYNNLWTEVVEQMTSWRAPRQFLRDGHPPISFQISNFLFVSCANPIENSHTPFISSSIQFQYLLIFQQSAFIFKFTAI